jgi:flagellar protein FliS
MAYPNYALEYRKHAVNGASPVGLIVMLYDGALRFMEAGKAAVLSKDYETQGRSLLRAQRILLHLMGTLDLDKGGHIATNLLSLYSYANDRLIIANMEGRVEPIDEAIHTISELRQGWSQIEERNKNRPSEQVVAA